MTMFGARKTSSESWSARQPLGSIFVKASAIPALHLGPNEGKKSVRETMRVFQLSSLSESTSVVPHESVLLTTCHGRFQPRVWVFVILFLSSAYPKQGGDLRDSGTTLKRFLSWFNFLGLSPRGRWATSFKFCTKIAIRPDFFSR
jgi:hypothetical protein